ncbi:MAG: DUF5615 family PIN-like protein [Caldilineaceae bacterium]
MAERIRFHLDEHIDLDVARALRRQGIDITTTSDAGLRTKSDAEEWAHIQRNNRVIVTHDADFLRLSAANPAHPGIAYCRMGSRSLGEMIRSLMLIYEILTPDEMRGHVEYL